MDFFRSRAQLDVILETEYLHGIGHEIGDGTDFRIELFRGAQDMGVILGKLPDPEQAVKHTGFLMRCTVPSSK